MFINPLEKNLGSDLLRIYVQKKPTQSIFPLKSESLTLFMWSCRSSCFPFPPGCQEDQSNDQWAVPLLALMLHIFPFSFLLLAFFPFLFNLFVYGDLRVFENERSAVNKYMNIRKKQTNKNVSGRAWPQRQTS